MPYLQTVLIVIGSSALGTFGGCILALGLCFLLPSKPGDWGGAYLALFLLMTGSIAGLIAGFIQGYRWITLRGTRPWKPITWIGIVVGMLLGACSHVVYPGVIHELTRIWWLAIIPILAFGMLGGLISTHSSTIEKFIPRPARRKPRKKRKATRSTLEDSR